MLNGTVGRAIPIALAALCGVVSERAAVINIAIEGIMLMAALTAVVSASLSGSLLVGLVVAILTWALIAAFHAVLVIRFKVDQIVSGVAINIFGTGMTSFISSRYLESNIDLLNNSGTMKIIPILLLSQIPVLGPIFFESIPHCVHNPAAGGPAALNAVLHAVGVAHPRSRGAPQGRGYSRDQCVSYTVRERDPGRHDRRNRRRLLHRWRGGPLRPEHDCRQGFHWPGGHDLRQVESHRRLPVVLLFGFADSLQVKMQILRVPIPSEFLAMAPYIITMIVLTGIVGRAIPPAADGAVYEKQ
jgi:simple sugar transport system permease protein